MTLPFTLTYKITPDGWLRLRASLNAEGVNLGNETSGTISTHGVTAEFTQDGSTLEVKVTHKPFYASCQTVAEVLTQQINSALE